MSGDAVWRWAPGAVLAGGVLLSIGVNTQQAVALRADLGDAVPARIDGFVSRDIVISDQEIRVAGVSNYLMREFVEESGTLPNPTTNDVEPAATAFSVYVGYYDSQTQGKTIHSPKNCLPGAGWEALQSQRITLETPDGQVPANRYLLQRDEQQALVVYWYQGRGRVEANEYLVKAQLLRDAALRGRTEEALVRIVVPIVTNEADAFRIAAAAAARLVPSVDRALPSA